MDGDFMKIRRLFIVALLLLFCVTSIFSERITLNDGKELEGYPLYMDQEIMKIKLIDGEIISVKREDVVSIQYDNSYAENVNGQNFPAEKKVPYLDITPIGAIYPPVSYPIETYTGMGLLDPELEARKRIVKYNENRKNPTLAASLGFVFPGCGHFYSGRIGEGFFFLGSRTLFGALTWFGFKKRIDANTNKSVHNDLVLGSVGAVGFTAITIFEVIDAYYTAEAFNENLKLKLGIETLHDNVMPVFE